MNIWINHCTTLELKCPVLESPQPVYQHAENMDRYRFFGIFERESQQSFDSTQLAFSVPASWDRLLLRKTGLAEPILEGSVTVLMEAYLAVCAMEERIVLFVVRTETGSAGSFEDAFVVFAGLLTFLATDKLLEFLLVSDRFFFVHNPVQLYFIHIREIIQVVDLRVHERFPQILLYETLHVVVPGFIVVPALLIT